MAACAACEDQPKAPNIPCAVCGKGAAPETLAWAVVGEEGKMVGFNYDRMTAQHLCNPGERIARVAIRVVEGGDDAT